MVESLVRCVRNPLKLAHSDLRYDAVNSSFSTVIFLTCVKNLTETWQQAQLIFALVYSFKIVVFLLGYTHAQKNDSLWWKITVLAACWRHYKAWKACIVGAELKKGGNKKTILWIKSLACSFPITAIICTFRYGVPPLVAKLAVQFVLIPGLIVESFAAN